MERKKGDFNWRKAKEMKPRFTVLSIEQGEKTGLLDDGKVSGIVTKTLR